MEFPTIDEYAKNVAEKVLDEIIYGGKTIREWIEIIIKQHPCDDAISRKEALECARLIIDDEGIMHEMVHVDDINDLPSMKPKSEPCDDAISRQAAIDVVRKWFDKIQLNGDICLDGIISLPPVTPWSSWTPATQLPEPNTAVLLYVKYKPSGRRAYQLGMWNESTKSWEDWRTLYQLEEEFEIIKWMELPE